MITTVSMTNVNTVSAQDLANGAKRQGARKAFAHKIYNYNIDFEDKVPYNDDIHDVCTEIINAMVKDTGIAVLNPESVYTTETGIISIRFVNNAKMLYETYTFDVSFKKGGTLYDKYVEDYDSLVIKAVHTNV